MQVSRSMTINRPIEDVYRFVVDPDNDPRWCRWVQHSELVSGTAGRPGARYRQRQRPGPVGRNLNVEVRHADEPTHVHIRWHTSAAVFEVQYELAETAGGTRLTQVSDVSFRGLGRLSRPLVALAVPRTMQEQLRDLKALLEHDARVG